VLSWKINQTYIAKNICENRYKPQLNCNGKCILAKKLSQQNSQQTQKQSNSEFPQLQFQTVMYAEAFPKIQFLPFLTEFETLEVSDYRNSYSYNPLGSIFQPPKTHV
jgi:hypothetical protein